MRESDVRSPPDASSRSPSYSETADADYRQTPPSPRRADYNSPPTSARNLACFACLGLLNNVVFAISNASAANVLPDAVATVYIINTAPGLAIKFVAPLWIDLVSYETKFLLVGASLAFNLFVLLLPGMPTWLKLLGIALGDTGSSAGEASCMALTQFYAQPRRHIAYFAMGTGFSGVVGYGLKMYVLTPLGTGGSLLLGAFLIILYWSTYFLILDTPWVDTPAVYEDSTEARAAEARAEAARAEDARAAEAKAADLRAAKRRAVELKAAAVQVDYSMARWRAAGGAMRAGEGGGYTRLRDENDAAGKVAAAVVAAGDVEAAGGSGPGPTLLANPPTVMAMPESSIATSPPTINGTINSDEPSGTINSDEPRDGGDGQSVGELLADVSSTSEEDEEDVR